MRRKWLTCILALVSGGALAAERESVDWPQWRGPDRSGVTPEHSGHPKGWPPKKRWAKNVGYGCTSPIVVDGRLYVMSWRGKGRPRGNPAGTDSVTCFDGRTGRELWKQSYRCRYQARFRAGDTGQYGGPSSTPAFDLDTRRLYTLSTDGGFRCWDTEQGGKLVWSMNLYETYKVRRRPNVGGGQRDYGFTSSPLILGDTVIIEVGVPDGTVMAFDRKSGERRWASALTGPAGHTSGPVPITVDGVPCLATLTLTKLVVMRIDKGHEGKTVAEYLWRTDYACSLPTPAVSGSGVVLTSSYNRKRTELVDVTLKGAKRVWTARANAMVCTPVVRRGRVYMVWAQTKCLDLKTGRQVWKGGSFYHGTCLVTGDGKVLVLGKGRLVLLDAGPKYKELGRVNNVVRGVCYPHVVLSHGLIVCKDKSGNMVVFSVRE